MSAFKELIPLFLTLFICTFDGYSMMNYRVTARHSYFYFAVISVLCLAVNSYIAVQYGILAVKSEILFTIGLPYFFLILLITKDRISQTVFNFWLWINIYEIITSASAFIDDYTVGNYYFMSMLRIVFLCGYFVIYNKFLRSRHKALMEKSNVNWWIFSFIPMLFTVLLYLINCYPVEAYTSARKYLILLTVHILMLLVYILIFYTFKTADDSMEKQQLAQSMKEQIRLQKKQYEFYLQKAEAERIFRHDARHRDMILLSYLENGDAEGAKEFIDKELCKMETDSAMQFCGSTLINAVLMEYRTKAQQNSIEFSADIQMPVKLSCDESEFCVMLSNLLENSIQGAKSYICLNIKPLNHQILLNIKNDYEGELKKGADGSYITTKLNGSGLGLKSVNSIIRNNHGFLKIDDENGVFEVFAALKN